MPFIETVFMIMFLTTGFLLYGSLTFSSPVISLVQWPTVFLGGFIILYRLINFKDYLKTKGIFILFGFVASYVLSAVLAINYGGGNYASIRYFIFLVFIVGILYATGDKADKEYNKKRFSVLSFYFILCTALMSLISFFMLVMNVSEVLPQEAGPTVVIGIAWGRLFGAYWDPNIGAAMAALSVTLSVFHFSGKKVINKVLLVLNIILQVLFITFSDSRTGRVTLFLTVTVYLGLVIAKRPFGKIKNNIGKISLKATLIVLVAVISLNASVVAKASYNSVVRAICGDKTNAFVIGSEGRDETVDSDISNRRFDIWNNAVEIFEKKPITGVSHFQIVGFVEKNLSESYILTNDHMVFDTMHNVVFDVLASQGIIGIVLLVSFGCYYVFIILKNLKRIKFGEDRYNTVLLSVIFTVLVSSMFMTEIIYVITPLTLIFWIAAGSLQANIKEISEEQN